MVGNHYYRDIEGARRVGMTPIWFRWNDRYPSPNETPAADYIVHNASELAGAIDAWIAAGAIGGAGAGLVRPDRS